MPVIDAGVVTNDIIVTGRAEFYSVEIIGAIAFSYYSIGHIAQIDPGIVSCMICSMKIAAGN